MAFQLNKSSKLFLRIVGLIIAVALVFFGIAVISTFAGVRAIKNSQLQQAHKATRLAKISLAPLRLLTFYSWPTAEAWAVSLDIIQLSPDLVQTLNESLQAVNSFSADESDNQNRFLSNNLMIKLTQLSRLTNQLNQQIEQSWLIQVLLSDQQLDQLQKIEKLTQDARLIADHYVQGEHQVVVLLHNNDELRASGGFMGSVAHFSLIDGSISEPIFYDIYDLASQTTQFTQAPIGVKLYLGAGQEGLALTDANWEADFSQSAQDIMALLNQTHLLRTDLLVAINLDLIRDILKVAGPVVLPDYPEDRQTVTAENLSQLARRERYYFFAGDKQKKLFLKDLYKSLKIKLARLSPEHQQELGKTLINSAQTKQFFFYSAQPQIQEKFVELRLAGAVNPATDFFLFPVESNVGINKANQKVERRADLQITDNLVQLKVDFSNNNHPLSSTEISLIENNPDLLQATHLGYVNYFRILTNLQFRRVYVECDGQPKALQEQDVVQTWQGKAQQIGFLVTLPEKSSVSCEIRFIPALSLTPKQTWSILKQPGLPETEYNITFFEQDLKETLTQDIVLKI